MAVRSAECPCRCRNREAGVDRLGPLGLRLRIANRERGDRRHDETCRIEDAEGTALATGTLALPPLVIEGHEEGSFDRLCLRAGTAAIEAMLVSDAQ